jgi:hypothetical protein
LTGRLPESVEPFTPERFLNPRLRSAARSGLVTATVAR